MTRSICASCCTCRQIGRAARSSVSSRRAYLAARALYHARIAPRRSSALRCAARLCAALRYSARALALLGASRTMPAGRQASASQLGIITIFVNGVMPGYPALWCVIVGFINLHGR